MPKTLINVTLKWLEGDDLLVLDPILIAKEWASLNKVLSRALVAYDENNHIIGFEVFECLPHVGPLWVDPEWRGSGITEEMTEQMMQFLRANSVRGFMLVAESVFASKLAEKYNMRKLDDPVYVKIDTGSGV